MGTTLDMLNGADGTNGGSLTVSAVIEGIPYTLTDGHPGQVYTAWGAASIPRANQVVGGLSVHWDMDQSASPWKPFIEPSMIKLSVVPGPLTGSSAYASVAEMSDIIGTIVGRRTGGTETHLAVAIDCDDTSIVGQRADDFAASGDLYMGSETATYSSRDTGTDTFTISERGAYPAGFTSTNVNFSRPHRPTTYTTPQQNVALNPVLATQAKTWIGRWVAVWIHRNMGGVLDAPDVDNSAAHLAFAGQIVGVEDVDGATVFTCEDLRRKINETVIMRDPYRAKVKEGVRLIAGQAFSVTTWRQVSGGSGTTGDGTNLTVVTSGAAGANQINEGIYSATELGEYINAWLQSEKLNGRILFNLRYESAYQDVDGHQRGRLVFNDPTTTGSLVRKVTLNASAPYYLMFLGWESGSIVFEDHDANGAAISGGPPWRVAFDIGSGLGTMTIEQARGTWVSQTTTLPQALRYPGNLIQGLFRVGKLGYLRVGQVTSTTYQYTWLGLESFFPGNAAAFTSTNGNTMVVTLDDDLSLEVEQVLLMHAPFKTLLLQMLLSTGTASFNHATYDNMGETISCAIPYSYLGADFITEVNGLECADTDLTCLVRKPTRFAELFEADFILRRCFMVWANGRLKMCSWATPNSGYAVTSLTETSKATPSGTQDKNRSQTSESDDFKNVIKIRYSPDAEGNLQDEVTLVDQSSVRDHGERAITINARNTFRQSGALGSQLDDLVSTFAGFMPITSRPWTVVRRSIDYQKFDSTYPGSVVTLTDKYLRDPATGLRYSNQTASGGMTGYPGMCLGHRFSWGGSESGRDGAMPSVDIPAGEVDLFISPQRSQAVYVPCAQFDETASNAGYVVATKIITCYAHKFTESSESADASFFGTGDKVFITQIDSESPLTWSDTVASQTGNTITLTTGLGGFDNTKRYVIMYDAYGTVTSTQKAKCYQADDADGLIVDTAQAYGFGWFGLQQGTQGVATVEAATTLPALIASNAYGDGRPMDVWHDINAARMIHNFMDYKSAPQQPTSYASAELRGFTGAGTYQLVEMQPIFVGMMQLLGSTINLSVSPRLRSTDGSTAEVRIRLCKFRPTGTTCDDVTFTGPYQSVSFTTTSTTFSVPTAQTLDIAHLKLSDGLLGGIGYLTVEIKTKTEFTGLARCVIGAPS
jgi:hypothetical protein